ncbi:hypothetical protein ACFQGE_00545 [Halomicroarcula sp. GCM10025817]|uniref:hypothetical protein n=1 Tax=Haloarcula TaxID=2237 RepID=UPI0023E84294|nr:hypothetical protein [Halomicroarcula sp. SYNS111]
MSLDVPVPDPPALRGPQPRGEYDAIGASTDEQADDYRREEVAEILEAGAWHDGFEEWATQTSLVPADFELVVEHDLIDGFDFYWDPATDEVGYRAPALPEAVERDLEVGDADEIELELDALGRIVSEMLENDYLPRDEETFGFFDDEAPESEFDAEPERHRGEEPAEEPTEEPTRDPLSDDTRR